MLLQKVGAAFGIELTHGKWRIVTSHLGGELFWNIGVASLAGLVYGVPNMRTLQYVIGAAPIPWMVLWYFMPESPRWLLMKGPKYEQAARKVIEDACKLNKKPLEPVDKLIEKYHGIVEHEAELEELSSKEKTQSDDPQHHQASFTDLFRWPGMRRNSCCIMTVWFAMSCAYFGLMYNTPDQGWNKYLVYALPPLMLIPLGISQIYFENKFGRKIIMTSSLFAAAVMMLVSLAFPKGMKIDLISYDRHDGRYICA